MENEEEIINAGLLALLEERERCREMLDLYVWLYQMASQTAQTKEGGDLFFAMSVGVENSLQTLEEMV